MDSLIIFGAKYLFALILLGAFLPFFWLLRERTPEYIMAAVIAGVTAFGLTKLAGSLYLDPRPFTQGVQALMPHEPDNGFPSDHTVLSFAAATLTYSTSKYLSVPLLLLAAIVGSCRVLSGVHHPVDAVVGGLIGIVAALLGTWLASHLRISRA